MSMSLSAVKVRKSVRRHSGNCFCTKNRGLLVAQAVLELEAKMFNKQTIWLFVKML